MLTDVLVLGFKSSPCPMFLMAYSSLGEQCRDACPGELEVIGSVIETGFPGGGRELAQRLGCMSAEIAVQV